MKNGGQIPSQTALFSALRRAIAHKKYENGKFGPDHLAEIFLPAYYRFFLRFEKIRENTRAKLEAFMPGLNNYLIARTAYFDRLFIAALNDNIPQIVILGAGYDSRAYRFGNINQNSDIYELDSAPTQNRKIKCLKAARIPIPQSIKYAPINFMEETLGEGLKKAGYHDRKKTLFLWEGVSYYLNSESVAETLAFVGHSAHPAGAIAFDYTIPLSEKNLPLYFGSSKFLESMKEHHTNEKFMFSLEEGKIVSFLRERNLEVMEHLDNTAIEKTYLLDDNGSLIGRMTGNFRFVLASPMGK
jgi:methyltransferase (TIGR00027 family)